MVTEVLLITITVVVVVPIALSANFRPGWWDHDSLGLLNGALSDNEWKYYYVAWKKNRQERTRLNRYILELEILMK